MSASEMQDWRNYYAEHPFDDVHRYHRPAAVVAGAFGGGDFGKTLDFLINGKPKETQLSDIDQSILKAFS